MRSLILIGCFVLAIAATAFPASAAQRPGVAATVDALRAATVAGDLDTVVSLYGPDATLVSPFGTFTGRAAIRGFYEGFLAMNPGLNVTFTDRTVVLGTEVHRSVVISDSVRAAGVARILLIETIVVADGVVVSATVQLDLADSETARFAALAAER
jgi:hypothetical protein